MEVHFEILNDTISLIFFTRFNAAHLLIVVNNTNILSFGNPIYFSINLYIGII